MGTSLSPHAAASLVASRVASQSAEEPYYPAADYLKARLNADWPQSPAGTDPNFPLGDIIDTNMQTKNVEFHGPSSSYNFLHLAERDHRNTPSPLSRSEQSLVSSLHNPATDHDDFTVPLSNTSTHEYFPHAAAQFIDGYFNGIHYAQPFLDRRQFIQQCETLWRQGNSTCSNSFLALYYGVLSLGALLMVWPNEQLIDGQGRFQWSRKLFEKARLLAGQLGQTTDLEAVQCFFFLAKICQNELSPHIAYLYLGRAVRIALAMGLNRDPGNATNILLRSDPAVQMAETRTWWTVYSLEIELSFSLGRPDSVGPDGFHSRPFPRIEQVHSHNGIDAALLEPTEVQVIEFLARLSRIAREISFKLYNSTAGTPRKVQYVREIDAALNKWLRDIPLSIRPCNDGVSSGLSALKKQRPYIRKQSLVLGTSEWIENIPPRTLTDLSHRVPQHSHATPCISHCNSSGGVGE